MASYFSNFYSTGLYVKFPANIAVFALEITAFGQFNFPPNFDAGYMQMWKTEKYVFIWQ